MGTLSRIAVYPIKALDPMEVTEARIVQRGGLEHDRAWAMFDRQGKLVNGKRTDRVHRVRTVYEKDLGAATFWLEGSSEKHRFDLRSQRSACEAFLSDALGVAVELRPSPEGGLPDDTTTGGPTVVSEASLQTVASWFPGLTAEEIGRRMRVNLVVSATDAFWEDLLVDELDRCVGFRIGEAELEGVSACGRCVVPTRDATTGEQWREFQHVFTRQREATFRPDVPRTGRFNHFYRLTTRTRVVPASWGRTLHVGDPASIIGVRPL